MTDTLRQSAPPGIPSVEAVLGRARGENFPVAVRALPKRARGHLMAFYGFARLVDELGDSFEGDRLGALAWVEAEVEEALRDPTRPELHPLVAAAASSAIDLDADRTQLYSLIEANRRDQTTGTYATYDGLLGYCRLSANPVGRLVLAAFDATTPEREQWSDSICTGLQLVEHWQDVSEDARAGRVYLPAEDLSRFGVDPAALAAPPYGRPLQALLAFEAVRARELLDAGSPLVASLHRSARLAVAGFSAGGHAALDELARRRFQPAARSLRPSPWRLARRGLTVLWDAHQRRPGR